MDAGLLFLFWEKRKSPIYEVLNFENPFRTYSPPSYHRPHRQKESPKA